MEHDEVLAYRKAQVPVLNTLLRILRADAIFLWGLFDTKDRIASNHPAVGRIHEVEKQSLCVAFYEYLLEQRPGLLPAANGAARSKASEIESHLKSRYSILKFIEGVSRQEPFDDGLAGCEAFERLSFGYGQAARPRKYVVLDDLLDHPFQVFSTPFMRAYDGKEILLRHVELEGITAYHTRENTMGIYTKTELTEDLRDLAIGLNYDRMMVWRRGEGRPIDHCEHLCVFPIEFNGEVIGVLKADSYHASRQFENSRVEQVCQLLPFLGEFMIHSREGVQSLTYLELCKGRGLLDALIETQRSCGEDSSPSMSKVLGSLTHLFHVFNRGTYIGWTEIIGRINHLLEELESILGLQRTGLLDKFERFRRYDELLLEDVVRYREHYIHQFHTFVLGVILILEIGVNRFVQWANAQLDTRSNVFRHPIARLDDLSVIRTWFLASMYHDYAYILERFDDGMARFMESILPLENFTIQTNWAQILLNRRRSDSGLLPAFEETLSRYLVDMAEYSVSAEDVNPTGPPVSSQVVVLSDLLWRSVVSEQQHGPISALVLLDLLLSDPNVTRKEANEAYLAALAVACHDKAIFGQIASAFGRHHLSLEAFPFTFLLAYCDIAQEWGRRKQLSDTSPWLESIEASHGEDGPTEIRTTICYDSLLPGRVPTPKELLGHLGPWQDSFWAHRCRFVIDYWQGERGFKDANGVRIMRFSTGN